jgi:hypothetical protein
MPDEQIIKDLENVNEELRTEISTLKTEIDTLKKHNTETYMIAHDSQFVLFSIYGFLISQIPMLEAKFIRDRLSKERDRLEIEQLRLKEISDNYLKTQTVRGQAKIGLQALSEPIQAVNFKLNILNLLEEQKNKFIELAGTPKSNLIVN